MGLKIGLIGHIPEGKYSDIYLCPPNPQNGDNILLVPDKLLLKELILGTKESEESKMADISILKYWEDGGICN